MSGRSMRLNRRLSHRKPLPPLHLFGCSDQDFLDTFLFPSSTDAKKHYEEIEKDGAQHGDLVFLYRFTRIDEFSEDFWRNLSKDPDNKVVFLSVPLQHFSSFPLEGTILSEEMEELLSKSRSLCEFFYSLAQFSSTGRNRSKRPPGRYLEFVRDSSPPTLKAVGHFYVGHLIDSFQWQARLVPCQE